ncbi:MAG: hypothetical protein CBC34_003395 [Hyphomicrobiaceae bacterium TMED74]|nr:hypothetical protein [Filomicrobium sp.]RPG46230.1 MAG: hypothetical protein CBC34_003395 [Hyphomicrobiaceae bacterium TMED74]
MRLHILSVIFVACAMLSFGGVVAPERAMAQVGCPAADGNVSASREVQYITFRAADRCIALPFSHNPYTYPFSMPFDFMLHLPGNGAVNGSANPAQVNMKNASGVPLDVTMIACDGATVGKITAPVSSLGVGEIGQILLDDQES